LPGEELSKQLALIDSWDSVEPKLTLPACEQRSTIAALGLAGDAPRPPHTDGVMRRLISCSNLASDGSNYADGPPPGRRALDVMRRV
jgi:hypothetical protein